MAISLLFPKRPSRRMATDSNGYRLQSTGLQKDCRHVTVTQNASSQEGPAWPAAKLQRVTGDMA
jgi:hypothetical protein